MIFCPSSPTIFSHIVSQKQHTFRKNVLNRKYVSWFSLTQFCGIFLILRRIGQVIIINVHRPSRIVLLFLSDFNETCIFLTDICKSSNIKLHKNPSRGRRIVAHRRTDRQTERRDKSKSSSPQLFNYIDFSQLNNKLTTIIFIVYSYMFRLTWVIFRL